MNGKSEGTKCGILKEKKTKCFSLDLPVLKFAGGFVLAGDVGSSGRWRSENWRCRMVKTIRAISP
jgi:hypothetical protein